MQLQTKEFRFVAWLYGYSMLTLICLALIVPKGQEIHWINAAHSPVMDQFFKLLTRLGEGWLFIPMVIIGLFVRYSLALSVLAMAALNGIACAVLKNILFSDAPRPTASINNELLHFVPGVAVHAQHSFPSGHTATIFCFAVLASVWIRHRLASILILLMALGVGYSRMYLLQHFLVDVSAGALVGTSCAFLIIYWFDRLNLPTYASS